MTTILGYADDVMLRINNAKKLQVNLNHLNNIGNTFGLEINLEKTTIQNKEQKPNHF